MRGDRGVTRLVRLDTDRVAYLPQDVVASLKEGGMAIYPTDTLYGLGVDPRSEAGISRLLAIKRREGGKPIPLLLSGAEDVERFARHVPEAAARLMGRFWPGALTLVLPAEAGVHEAITGGGGTVGLRVPDHPVPRALARALSGAITGTSANRSGNPGDWESAEEIVREFTGEADWVLWDGKVRGGGTREGVPGRALGSTVVRLTDDRPVLLREGVVPYRDIIEFMEKG
jgi:L-threonylcarbamoyladenylate synthase